MISWLIDLLTNCPQDVIEEKLKLAEGVHMLLEGSKMRWQVRHKRPLPHTLSLPAEKAGKATTPRTCIQHAKEASPLGAEMEWPSKFGCTER